MSTKLNQPSLVLDQQEEDGEWDEEEDEEEADEDWKDIEDPEDERSGKKTECSRRGDPLSGGSGSLVKLRK